MEYVQVYSLTITICGVVLYGYLMLRVFRSVWQYLAVPLFIVVATLIFYLGVLARAVGLIPADYSFTPWSSWLRASTITIVVGFGLLVWWGWIKFEQNSGK